MFQDLYNKAPIFVQNILVSAGGFLLHHRRYGGDCKLQAQGLAQSQWWDEGQLIELQRRKWLSLAREVLPRRPFYRALMEKHGIEPRRFRGLEDLQRFPLLEKEALRVNPRSFLDDEVNPSRLFVSSTSGTTGSPLVLYTDWSTERAYYAFYLRQMEWMGVRMGEPRATFFGRTLVPVERQKPPFWRYDLAENNWQFSSFHLSDAYLPHYLKKLRDIAPVEIRGYPSSLVQVARAVRESGAGRAIRPRAIKTTAETLTADWRRDIERAFEAPVFDEYGTSEMSHFVTQCTHGRYHAHPEFGILEVLHGDRPAQPGEEGEVVATSFVNTTQPLVRYRVGDIAVPGGGSCPCGRQFPVIERILGRVDDYVVTLDGRRIGRLDPVFKGSSGIRECQIVQDSREHLLLRIVYADTFERADLEHVLQELRARVGPEMRISVEEIDEIPKSASGKFKAVVRLHAESGD